MEYNIDETKQLIQISKEFTIDIAHIVTTQKLPSGMFCKCKQIHGHTVTVIPIITGTINKETRMVVDYTLLGDFKKMIDEYLDHKLVLPMRQKTFGLALQEVHSSYVDLDFGENETKVLKRIDGSTLIEVVGSVSFVDRPSTTAEDMLFLFLNMLVLSLSKYEKEFDFSNIKFISMEFKETPKSSCKLSVDMGTIHKLLYGDNE